MHMKTMITKIKTTHKTTHREDEILVCNEFLWCHYGWLTLWFQLHLKRRGILSSGISLLLHNLPDALIDRIST